MIIDRSIARIAANRIADFLTRKPSLNIAACACAFTAVYGAGIVIHAQEPQAPAATQPAQHTSEQTTRPGRGRRSSRPAKVDHHHLHRVPQKRQRARQLPVADPSGKLHWVYLAGVDLPAGE